jgi:hypothetical protein
MAVSVTKRLVQRIITILKGVSAITDKVGSGNDARIYGAQVSTIVDAKWPAISMHVLDGQKQIDQAGHQIITFQLDIWYGARGTNAGTWDDVFDLWEEVLEILHNNGAWDEDSVTVKIIELTNIGVGPQLFEEGPNVFHLPTRWRARALI